MENFIVGNGFVLDGVIYVLEEKIYNGYIATFYMLDKQFKTFISIKDMQKAEIMPF